MIYGIGTDIVEIVRIEKAIGRESFLRRVFTEQERRYAKGRGVHRVSSLAARFAAKEAVMKAFGTGLRGGRLLDIEIRTDTLGAPFVRLSGAFLKLAQERGISRIHITLSHAREYATAVCMLEGRG